MEEYSNILFFFCLGGIKERRCTWEYHTQKVVMDWRQVYGILCFGGKWEKEMGWFRRKVARLFSVYPLTYIYRFPFFYERYFLECSLRRVISFLPQVER